MGRLVKVYSRLAMIVLGAVILQPLLVIPHLIRLHQCAPSAFDLVVTETRFIVLVPGNISYAHSSGMTLLSISDWLDRDRALLVLTHEARHHWQFSRPEFASDWLQYRMATFEMNENAFARYRIEYDAIANPFMQEIRDHCY